MRRTPPDFTQTQYQGWNTIGDIFHDEAILKILDEYKKFIHFGTGKTKGHTDGDLLEMIFSDEDKTEEFLQFARSDLDKIGDIRKIIAFILSIQHFKIALETTPQSVIGIFSHRIHDIIETAKENEYDVESEHRKESYSYYMGLDILLGNNDVLPITTEGKIVYYHSHTEDVEDDDTIYVWDEDSNEILHISKDGEVLSKSNPKDEPKKTSLKVIDGESQKTTPTIGNIKDATHVDSEEKVVTHPRFVGVKDITKKRVPKKPMKDPDTTSQEQ